MYSLVGREIEQDSLDQWASQGELLCSLIFSVIVWAITLLLFLTFIYYSLYSIWFLVPLLLLALLRYRHRSNSETSILIPCNYFVKMVSILSVVGRTGNRAIQSYHCCDPYFSTVRLYLRTSMFTCCTSRLWGFHWNVSMIVILCN